MIRKFFIISILLCSVAVAKAQSVSCIEERGSWVYVYDEKGKKISTQSASTVGSVKGWSSTFWVSKKGNWYYLWTPKGKRYKTMSAENMGEVIGVSGNTFTTRRGNWVYTYDQNGKRLSSRYSAR